MFKKITKITVATICSCCLFTSFLNSEETNGNAGKSVPDSWRLGEPVSYKNLMIVPILNDEQLDKKFLTLSEAMENKQVIVDETGNVNQLSIENVSENYVFVHSGDVVKGGKQDRLLSVDIILPPKSGKLPVESFCVESGRWRKRKGENINKFSGNSCMISSKRMRMASKGARNQSEVWSSISEHQKKLKKNIQSYTGNEKTDVINKDSATSYQLTSESDDLKGMMKDYLKHFTDIPAKNPDIVGFAYAVNGEVNNAEIYCNTALFKSLWNKLINAAVMEAVSEYKKVDKLKKVGLGDFQKMFKEALKGKLTKRLVNKQTEFLSYDSKDYLLFQTKDLSNDGKWVHLNYILKGNVKLAPNNTRNNRTNNLRQRNQSERINNPRK